MKLGLLNHPARTLDSANGFANRFLGRRPHRDAGRAGESRMRSLGDLDEAHPGKGSVVLAELDPRLQLECYETAAARFPPCRRDQRLADAAPLQARPDRELADIERVAAGPHEGATGERAVELG